MAEKMLVVDRERYIVRLVEVNLARAGYDVVAACSCADAIDAARRDKPDVIVVDEMMPGRGELLRALEADPVLQNIPVVTPDELLRFRSPRKQA